MNELEKLKKKMNFCGDAARSAALEAHKAACETDYDSLSAALEAYKVACEADYDFLRTTREDAFYAAYAAYDSAYNAYKKAKIEYKKALEKK